MLSKMPGKRFVVISAFSSQCSMLLKGGGIKVLSTSSHLLGCAFAPSVLLPAPCCGCRMESFTALAAASALPAPAAPFTACWRRWSCSTCGDLACAAPPSFRQPAEAGISPAALAPMLPWFLLVVLVGEREAAGSGCGLVGEPQVPRALRAMGRKCLGEAYTGEFGSELSFDHPPPAAPPASSCLGDACGCGWGRLGLAPGDSSASHPNSSPIIGGKLPIARAALDQLLPPA